MKQIIPELSIERIGYDSATGHVDYIDVHDESRGMALFCKVESAHFHGFNNPKNARPVKSAIESAPKARKGVAKGRKYLKGPNTPQIVKNTIQGMAVGDVYDATDDLAPLLAALRTFRKIQTRIAGYVWLRNKDADENSKRSYTVERTRDSRTEITRVK